MAPLTLIDVEADGEPTACELDATIVGGTARVAPDALASATGWSLRPEGLCRGDVCVPVRDRAALERAGSVDLAAFAAALGRPLALDLAESAAALGAAAADRAASLASLEAPDFRLPDLSGTERSLSEQRGRKVLLVTWASW